ncbi:sigma-70 family RNA polymerase sigma factor [Pedobacter sp. MR2016-19]|uniref:RNA polymerase sigma factor n=1 Tax=Pedobacter sp. MR2016-19 TaxID=2780089 RepID=UPI0018743670|nr:sigma-70 family RNA polymerase sigma factor [Pedobacter sp. MR2016-19]MBE5317743.1 sigma-70 family RNA polymerase sigma factor [Pedobacter sp. MR2016-19]
MDNALITSAISGNRGALEHLLNKFRNNAFSIALKFVKERAEAEDVVQEAFIKVFLNIEKFRNEASFSTWLYRIVYIESIRILRKNNQLHTLYSSIDPLIEVQQHTQEDTEIFVKEKIEVAMKALSAREFLVVNLFYLSEKTINDIALVTNESTSNIKVMLHRARKKMSNHLSKVL